MKKKTKIVYLSSACVCSALLINFLFLLNNFFLPDKTSRSFFFHTYAFIIKQLPVKFIRKANDTKMKKKKKIDTPPEKKKKRNSTREREREDDEEEEKVTVKVK